MMKSWLFVAGPVVIFSVLVATVHAQRRYELIVEGTDVVSQAERTPQRLVIIDARGNATEYARDRRFDPEDRGFLAYFSAAARQVLRWPASDRGNMQIADFVDGRPTAFRRSWMTIRSLESALVEFVNSHSKELWVLVADRRNPAKSMRLRILAGESETIPLERDAGGTLIEVYEYGVPGLTQRDEFATPLPPAVRYDVSVYELAVQSITIDRTVPGGKLENVNYSPKSVGWFELAPGPELESGPLDVFQTAARQKNAGAVRRIDPSEWEPHARPTDPVESLLDEFRKREEQ
jgi:hypothetical protein